jgi:transcriptional regulator GlxA family with amidase domain
MRVHVLVLDGVFDLGLAAVLDAFQTANELLGASTIAVERFDVKTVAVRHRIRTSQGLRVPIPRVDRRTPDCVVVPAIGYKMPAPLEKALERPDIQDATHLLRDYAKRGATMTAACIGTFVMAESGLLSGHRATTTWWLAPLFRRRYPDVALEDSSMIVDSGPFVTAGAALGHLDLALWLVRRVSPQLASLTAQYLIVDSRASQAAYALTDHLVHADPMVRKFEAYVQSVRVERAVHLLKTTPASVDEIAARVGYADGVTLRTLLRRRLHAGVREIRVSS